MLIADEPTTALDATVQVHVLDLLGELQQSGTALLLLSHDLAVVARLADRIAVMLDGRIVESGPARQVLTAPAHPYTAMPHDAAPSLGPDGGRPRAHGRRYRDHHRRHRTLHRPGAGDAPPDPRRRRPGGGVRGVLRARAR